MTSAAECSENRRVRCSSDGMVKVKDAFDGGAAHQGAEFLGAAGAGQFFLGFDAEASG